MTTITDPRICDATGDEHAFDYAATDSVRCLFCDIRPSTVARLAREQAAAMILCVNVWQAQDGKFGMTCYDRDGGNASMVPAEFDTFEQAVADVDAFRAILARS